MTATPALPRRSDAEQERLDAAIKERIQTAAFNQVLGLVAECTRHPNVRLRVDMKPNLIGTPEHHRLHGGVIATMLDNVGGVAIFAAFADKFGHETTEQLQVRMARSGTLDLRVEFLRQGLGKYFIATAEVTRLGGRIASVQMRLVNDEGALIATGAANFIVS
jgi:uncharacterized protein (TIGR00369 family)